MKPINSVLFAIILGSFFSLLGVNAQTTIIVSSIGDDKNIGTVETNLKLRYIEIKN